MMVTKGGVGWDKGLGLPCYEFDWLYEQCEAHMEEMEKEVQKVESATRSARKGR